MLSPDDARHALSRLFRRRPVADLDALLAVLETPSRMSVFRRLSAIGYYSSYSHTGRYYTLHDIPRFDQQGLWQYEGIGFSRQWAFNSCPNGSLKSTVEHAAAEAEAGRTHHEMQVSLQVRVHNTLLELVRDKRIGRQPVDGEFVYLAKDPDRANAQLTLRQGIATAIVEAPLPVVVEVLLAVIQSGRMQLDAGRVAERLAARGLSVTADQVEAIFQRYELKKTVRSRSRRSQP